MANSLALFLSQHSASVTLTVHQETCAKTTNASLHKLLVQVASSLAVSQILTVTKMLVKFAMLANASYLHSLDQVVSTLLDQVVSHPLSDLVVLLQDSASPILTVTKMQAKCVMPANASYLRL